MKWFIASDIHGSAYYAEKMIEAYKREQADKMLLLGDILYHGPRNDLPRDYNPKKVILLLNEEKDRILCVRGNCDAEVDQMVLDFFIMDDFALIDDGVLIFATHGHVYNEEKLPDGKFDVLLHGHTHVPKVTEHENYTYINPGSVSIPKEDSHHGYMIFEDGVFLWKDFEGKIVKQYKI
ncbi:MAG: phosphodiesterase [Clostridia bacterium]|nr:phosphodiesterase [Clostridia bacterium]